jgi:hypothetical protein
MPVYQTIDVRRRHRADHAHMIAQARYWRGVGKPAVVMHCLKYAKRHRELLGKALAFYRNNDVVLIDQIAFVNSGGTRFEEVAR